MNTPEGWKLVPVEPTKEMAQAALDASRSEGPIEGVGNALLIGYELWSAEFVYRAMLAAAPTPPEQPAAQGELTDGMSAEQVARMFHECYERLAPSFGYETRKDTRSFDAHSANGKLMIAVCELVSSAVIAADRAACVRPEAEVAEIMEAVRALAYRRHAASEIEPVLAEVERLVRGEKS